jgi:hypothetical protein
MILGINSNKINKIGYLQPNNVDKNQKRHNPSQQKSSPSFKGGELIGFMNDLALGVIDIILGVGAIDSIFKKTAQKESKDFGLMMIKTDHKEHFDGIENLTKEVVLDLMSFKEDKPTQKLGKKLKKSYEKSFNTELYIKENTPTKERNIRTLMGNLTQLEDSLNKLFSKMNNKDSYTTIGKPFFRTLEKTLDKLLP